MQPNFHRKSGLPERRFFRVPVGFMEFPTYWDATYDSDGRCIEILGLGVGAEELGFEALQRLGTRKGTSRVPQGFR